ncbi:MAG: type II secretion system GspH family protein [Phycisphaerae bacterium]|nr:type II secretion system GspH family protein [Phycisphaerae bacterium]
MKRTALHSDRGFTLIEMVVVISVIAVLVTIVIGVSTLVITKAGVEQTKLNMEVIRQAIESYRDAMEIYPTDENDFTGRPAVGEFAPVPGNPSADARNYRNWQAYCRGEKLYEDLSSVPQARAHIANLSKDAIMNIEGNNVFVDGFDKYMEYFSDRGVGGTPVVISAGADGRFGTDAEPKYKTDNIRSDGQ